MPVGETLAFMHLALRQDARSLDWPAMRNAMAVLGLWAMVLCGQGNVASAQTQPRRVTLNFTPVQRAQVAVWIESADQELFQTVRLTQAVTVRGIGNRPGALQMNSGYHWPYGRREGVLPIWAHRRVAAGGASFPRVVFNGRVSEGNASSAGSANEPANTVDDYFCLSFTGENSDRHHLDAVSCASQFASNKGRYLTPQDVSAGYAEPFQVSAGVANMRALSPDSLYPPRRDVNTCITDNCGDHPDVRRFNTDARTAMPEIDAVTMATPGANVAQRIMFAVPESWPDGAYVAYVEINVEGDYNANHDDKSNPTPTLPSGAWDSWAQTFGYPYRGQPSVLYRVAFELAATGGTWSTTTPAGYGALHGENGEIHAMDGSISDDPREAPGSGADRLRFADDTRLLVAVAPWDACRRPNPPDTCGRECDPEDPTSCGADLVCSIAGNCVGICDGPDAEIDDRCGDHCVVEDEDCGPGLLCADDGACVGMCEIAMVPATASELVVRQHHERRDAHRFAHLSFTAPISTRGIARYEVRVGTSPITDDASFQSARPAVQATAEGAELMLPISAAPGETVEADFGGLLPELHYFVGVRVYDECNAASEIVVGEFTTPATYFTTVTACFVATAAYGTPLANEVGVLRNFRDRHLLSNAIGRALVDAYYAIGPSAAAVIRERPWLRAVVRSILQPIVNLLR